MLWNGDGDSIDESDDVDDVDDVDDDNDIVDTEYTNNTIGESKFSINYTSSSVLSIKPMTWCFINDVDEDEICSVNFLFDNIFTSLTLYEKKELKSIFGEYKVLTLLNKL